MNSPYTYEVSCRIRMGDTRPHEENTCATSPRGFFIEPTFGFPAPASSYQKAEGLRQGSVEDLDEPHDECGPRNQTYPKKFKCSNI